jgi:hypothetical protein
MMPGVVDELVALLSPEALESEAANATSCVCDLYDWLTRRLFQVGIHAVMGSNLDTGALYPYFRDLDAQFPLVMAGVSNRLA